MTGSSDDERPWMPEPVLADASSSADISSTGAFEGPEGRANVNRAPHDWVSGVAFKRAANVRRVRYTLRGEDVQHGAAPAVPEYQGTGMADVRWVFSEQPGSEEDLLAQHTFRYFQDVEFLPGASTEQRSFSEWDTVLYVIEGEGRLLHRPSAGSPNFVRPLRPFDAVLIRQRELFAIANASDTASLRLIILGLTSPETASRR
jgi:hypothetical protein